MKMILLMAGLILTGLSLMAQTLAFPGAEGFGRYTTGGRGGKVIVVTTLEDNGPGSLREAINKQGPRFIVFAVSGTIALKSNLMVKNGNVTIAGQSAPGDGICIRNYPCIIQADNVIIRYMRFRMGDTEKQEGDALGARGCNNMIIDHCSVSWATDECASFYRNRNFTLQWSIISESLNASVHIKGEHGYGGIWGGEGATFHHNLLASHKSRNPRFSGSASTVNPVNELVDFYNNVIYNWGINSTYGGEQGRYNMVNNYYKPGPATPSARRTRIVNPSSPYGRFFINGNLVAGNKTVSENNWAGGVQCDHPDSARENKPFETLPAAVESAVMAYEQVLERGGASFCRDAVDKRIIDDVSSGKATLGKHGIIDSQADAGGWPLLRSTSSPADSDSDGMPDRWEKTKGLDPSRPEDSAMFTLDKQYSNIEVYLNGLLK